MPHPAPIIEWVLQSGEGHVINAPENGHADKLIIETGAYWWACGGLGGSTGNMHERLLRLAFEFPSAPRCQGARTENECMVVDL